MSSSFSSAAAGGGGLVLWPSSSSQPRNLPGRRSCDSHLFFGTPTKHSTSPNAVFLRSSPRFRKKAVLTPPTRHFLPVMEWQDCKAEIEVDIPASLAYDCYSDRESIPVWMPFISSVKILRDKPDLSRWSLKYTIFDRDVEFSWLARNFQPIRNQKIHWRSLEGVPNRGAVRFYPKGPSSCKIELTVSYEIPQILAPVASPLKPAVEGLLLQGLEQFATFAKSYQSRVS